MNDAQALSQQLDQLRFVSGDFPRHLHELRTRAADAKRAFRTISQIGISYPHSALSQTLGALPGGAPKAGERFPWLHLRMQPNGPTEDLFQTLDDTRFNLLVFGPAPATAPAEYGDLVRTYTIPLDPNKADLDRVGITAPSFYLLRPDGHVGLCGPHAELPGVESYLARWLRA